MLKLICGFKKTKNMGMFCWAALSILSYAIFSDLYLDDNLREDTKKVVKSLMRFSLTSFALSIIAIALDILSYLGIL